MRRFIKAKNDRIGTQNSLLFELDFTREIVATIEVLDLVIGKVEVSIDSFCELKKVVVLGRPIVFVASVDCAKKERRLGRSFRGFTSKCRRAN